MLKGECFLGLDLSTQSLTAAVIDSHAGGIRQFSIWQELFGAIATSERARIVRPSPDATRRYHLPNGLLEAYAACERFAQGEGPEPEPKIVAFRSLFS